MACFALLLSWWVKGSWITCWRFSMPHVARDFVGFSLLKRRMEGGMGVWTSIGMKNFMKFDHYELWEYLRFLSKEGGIQHWHHDDNGTSTNKSTGRYGGKGMHSYIIKITHKRSLHRIIRYLREHRYRVGYPHYTWIHWLFTLRLYMITFLPVCNMYRS